MSDGSPSTAIIGAGFLGRELARCVSGPVLATTRTGAWGDGDPPPSVSLARLDLLLDPDARLDALLGDVARVVICVAPGRSQDRRQVYVHGVARAIDHLSQRSHRVARLVYTSSTSALVNVDAWIDDDDPRWPDDARGQLQREAEALVRARCEAAGIPWVVLRLGGLYGPGRPLGRLYRSAGDAPLAGDGMTATNLIHRDDAVAAAVAALALPSARSGVINVCADDHRPRRELFAAAAAREGRPPPRWERGAAEPHGKRVRNVRMKSWLGIELRHPNHVLDV